MKINSSIVKKTIHYMEAHLTEHIKLEDIAKEIGYSKYHLNRIFMEGTGQTIHQYLMERRLSESARELTDTDRNIADIAQDFGYSSQQAYTLAFGRFYHCTPQVYRQLYQYNAKQSGNTICKSVYSNTICKDNFYLISKGGIAA